MQKFKRIRIEGWRQFGHVDIELHPRLTILTGSNGAGKSTILDIFNRHFGMTRPLLATPRRDDSGAFVYLSGIFSARLKSFWRSIYSSAGSNDTNVGTLTYTSGHEIELSVPEKTGVQYELNSPRQQKVSGIHIDSHQPIAPFQQVQNIPTNVMSAQRAYQTYHQELTARYNGGHTGFSHSYRMKEALIAMALFGEGNTKVQGNTDILRAFDGFVSVLKKLLPEELGFIGLEVRPPEVVVVTRSGEFLIDAASGGVKSLIDIAWRLHLFSLDSADFVVTFDEPENHLHPTMQRSLLNRLLNAFPSSQFIVATHSPFMVSSVQDSNVYVLRYVDAEGQALHTITDQSRVVSQKLDTVNKAGSASEILREVLGVRVTTPEWVSENLAAIVDQFRDTEITLESLGELRKKLESLGYTDHYPEVLAELTAGK